MINPASLSYPASPSTEDQGTGVFPVDFLLEDVLRQGFKWFVTDPKAPDFVFSHLSNRFLDEKYGKKKILEIVDYLKKYELRIVQHWALIGEQMPCISIQLLDGGEMTERAALGDHEHIVNALNGSGDIIGQQQIKYSAISDSVHIGIHTGNTPDFCKYLYYLVVYILILFKPDLEERGLQLSTFRATDISKLNEYLPANIYSRFMNFSVFSIARFNAGDLPMVKQFLGLSVTGTSAPSDSGETESEIGGISLGITLDDSNVTEE